MEMFSHMIILFNARDAKKKEGNGVAFIVREDMARTYCTSIKFIAEIFGQMLNVEELTNCLCQVSNQVKVVKQNRFISMK